MGVTRSSVIVGPARCLLNSVPFFTLGDFGIIPDMQTFRVQPDGFSQGDERIQDVPIKIDLTPDGRINSSILAEFFPYANVVPGASAYGSSDKAFVAHGADAALATVLAVAVTKMPTVTFSHKKTLFGQLGLTGLLSNNMAPATASSRMTYAATGGTLTDAAFSLAAIKTQLYTAAWGAVTGFTSLYTENGFEFIPEVDLWDQHVDGLGVVDKRVQEVRCMVKFVPYGPTAVQILANSNIQGTGNGLGSSLGATVNALTITGADGIVYLTIPNAAVKGAGFKFGKTTLRNGEMAFVGILNQTTGVQGNLFTIAAS